MMMQKLFVDDLRVSCGDDWIVKRNSQEAIDYIRNNGLPDVITFDHDLGGDDTSMKIVHAITDMCLDKIITFTPEFRFFVHSDNPVGAKNIELAMRSLYRHFTGEEYPEHFVRIKNGEQDFRLLK